MAYMHYCRCGRLLPYGVRLCPTCQAAKDLDDKKRLQKRNRDRQKKYNPKYKNFYRSTNWIRLSRSYAQSRGYRCERCGEIGENVHHKIPIQTDEGWEKRLDFDNLELLCVRCHNKAHKRFTPRKRK